MPRVPDAYGGPGFAYRDDARGFAAPERTSAGFSGRGKARSPGSFGLRARSFRRRSGGRMRGGPNPFATADKIGALGALVVVTVALAMAAITERTVLTGSVPGSVAPPPPTVQTASARPPAPRPDPSPTKTVRPDVQAPDLTVLAAQVRRFTMAERGASAQQMFGKQPDTPLVTTTRFGANHRWAFGTSVIPAPSDRTALPQPALFLADWTGTRWQISLTGTAAFRAMLRQAPDSVVSATERVTLAKLGIGLSPGLMLPWKVGDFWQMPAVSTIAAFQGGDQQVLAAGDGRIYHFCGSLVMIVHDGGPATLYYGLSRPSTVPDGTRVKTGDYLGLAGGPLPCGGGTDQPEMLFGLTGADGGVPLAGSQIGGWTFREKDGFGWAERGPLKISSGGELPNFGPPFPFGPPATASPSPSPSQPGAPLLPGSKSVSTPTTNGSDRSSPGAPPQP